jgi:hypothetical protein
MTYLRAQREREKQYRKTFGIPINNSFWIYERVAVSSFILTLENSHQTHENEAQLTTSGIKTLGKITHFDIYTYM